MHNLHYILINGTDANDAALNAESAIEDFGNEDNWRTLGGIISIDGSSEAIHNYEGGRWSLEDLNKLEGDCPMDKINGELFGVAKESIRTKDALVKALANLGSPDCGSLYALREDIGQLISAQECLNRGTLNEYQYDEYGMSDLRVGFTGKGFIVMVDMHS